jgi:hypothetical protein
MKEKVDKLEENSKSKKIREMYKGINEFKKGYQPCTYVIKKHNGIIVAYTTSILSRWEQFFIVLLNVKGVKYTLQNQTSQRSRTRYREF